MAPLIAPNGELIESANLNVARMQGINPRGFPFWMKLVNALGNGFLGDMRCVQFAVVGHKFGN